MRSAFELIDEEAELADESAAAPANFEVFTIPHVSSRGDRFVLESDIQDLLATHQPTTQGEGK
jgi:hypothetical protein